MIIGLFPGSFDPVTIGHMNIIARAARMFDWLVVGVLDNPDKKTMFSAEDRVKMLQTATNGIPNVAVKYHKGLLKDMAIDEEANFIIRGVRGAVEYERELSLAYFNGRLLPGLETLFLPASPMHINISSSMVKQLALLKADFAPFVPASVAEDIKKHFDAIMKNSKEEPHVEE